MQTLVLILPVGAAVAVEGLLHLAALGVMLFVCISWEVGFALIRGRVLTGHSVTTALIVVTMVSASVPLWQLGIAVSFGVVLSELVFGGRGFGFINSAAASLAFLAFSFPGANLTGDATWIAVATLPGAVLLISIGLLPWRTLLAALVSLIVGLFAMNGTFDPVGTIAAVFFGLVFLICDPLASAATNVGRWMTGILAGGLIVLFSAADQASIAPGSIVFAALLTSVFAPLIDHVVILVNFRLRMGRHA
jgi:Na+-transporting NADH:ubiquinone oxidoreductase subunit B